jgi:nicotinamide phosphoribosyltransferase
MFKLNPLHSIDSYKLAHRPAYIQGTEAVYSNFTPRSVKYLNVPGDYKENVVVWVGGQAAIQDLINLWDEHFFEINFEEIDQFYKTRVAPFAGPDYDTAHVKELHELGYLPLEIRTLPEGTLVPVGVPVLTIINTDPRFFWLTNYLETHLSAELWKTPTAATIAYYYKKILTRWAEETGGSKEFITFQAHDFSHRGMSGSMDAVKTGLGHLAFFQGTDNIVSVDYTEYHYVDEDTAPFLIGASVPATEHSVATSYGKNEAEYLRRVVTEVYPKGIVSVVADSYDFFGFITNHVANLKEEILVRGEDALGLSKVVIRPDSGDPVKIITGYIYREINIQNKDECIVSYELGYEAVKDKTTGKYYLCKPDDTTNEFTFSVELSEEEVKGAIQVLWEIFGGSYNDKGFRTLNPKIGLIYGDSITLHRADAILRRLAAKGFASDNVVFGIGSYTYQFITRDTCGWAMKATYTVINGQGVELFKDPKTDDGTKKSAKGLLKVISSSVGYKLIDQVSWEESRNDTALEVVYADGMFAKFEDFPTIRTRLSLYF